MNVEDLDLVNKQAVIVGEGNNVRPSFRSSVTARLLSPFVGWRTAAAPPPPP